MCIITRDLGPVLVGVGAIGHRKDNQKLTFRVLLKSIYQSKLRAHLRTNCVIEFKLMVSVFAK